MNELQLQKTVKPTSVRVPRVTREWLKEQDGIRLADIVRYGPKWHDTMVQQKNELKNLREASQAKTEKIIKLQDELDELRKFKERTTARIKEGGLFK